MSNLRHPCPCCDHVTLTARHKAERCPVCFWLDRPGADGLPEARANFRVYGAARPEDLPFVTAPHERARYVRVAR